MGELGEFLKNCEKAPQCKNYMYINDALKQVADKRKMTDYVSAEGFTANADNLHFRSKSLGEFGIRYYEVFLKLEDKNKVFYEKQSPDNAIRTDLEYL